MVEVKYLSPYPGMYHCLPGLLIDVARCPKSPCFSCPARGQLGAWGGVRYVLVQSRRGVHLARRSALSRNISINSPGPGHYLLPSLCPRPRPHPQPQPTPSPPRPFPHSLSSGVHGRFEDVMRAREGAGLLSPHFMTSVSDLWPHTSSTPT